MLLTFHGPNEGVGNTINVPLDANGNFLTRGWSGLAKKLRATKLSAHYPGRAGYASCDAPNVLAL